MGERTNKKKNGEKSLILEVCWKLLSDSDEKRVGGVKVTQGIYSKINGTKTEVFCKRGVFVPESFCFEQIQNIFAKFGAKLSPSVSRNSVIGLCGLLPTRTAHADDTDFFLLTKIHEKFVVVAIVSTDEANNEIVRIQSDSSSISDAVKSVRDEAERHSAAKEEKHKKKKGHSSDDNTVAICEVTSKSVGIQRPREEEKTPEPSPKKAEYNEDQQHDSTAENEVTPLCSSVDISSSLSLSDCEVVQSLFPQDEFPSLFPQDEWEDPMGSMSSMNSTSPFAFGPDSDGNFPTAILIDKTNF